MRWQIVIAFDMIYDRAFILLADNSDFIFSNYSQTIFKPAVFFYDSDEIQKSADNFVGGKLSGQDDNNSETSGNIKTKDISKSSIESQKNSFFATSEIKNSIVAGADQIRFINS